MGAFQPKSQSDFDREAESRRLQPGQYDALVQSAVEKQGTYGPQFEISLLVYKLDGTTAALKDWIGLGSQKHLHFSTSARLMNEYSSGTMEAQDLFNKNVRIEVGNGKPNDEGKVFPKVKGYLPRTNQPVAGEPLPEEPVAQDDDIPF